VILTANRLSRDARASYTLGHDTLFKSLLCPTNHIAAKARHSPQFSQWVAPSTHI